MDTLRKNFGNDHNFSVHHCALGETEGLLDMNVMNQTAYSSLLEPDKSVIESTGVAHMPDAAKIVRAERVNIKRLDKVIGDIVNKRNIYLKIDTQGYDLKVFEGARGILPMICAMQSEIAFRTIYKDAPNYHEVIRVYNDAGFKESGFFSVNRDMSGAPIEADCVLVRTDK